MQPTVTIFSQSTFLLAWGPTPTRNTLAPPGSRVSSRLLGVGPRHHHSRGGDPTPAAVAQRVRASPRLRADPHTQHTRPVGLACIFTVHWPFSSRSENALHAASAMPAA